MKFELAVKDDEFWKGWPGGRPEGYDKFLALAKQGKPKDAWKPKQGEDRKEAQKVYQKREIEKSIEYCKEIGLGRR